MSKNASEKQAPNLGVLIVPGFNTRPTAMSALENYIASLGIPSRRIGLSGMDSPRLALARRSDWSAQVISEAARFKNDLGGADVVGLGFSLGGAMTLRASVEGAAFSKIILFAPALRLTPLSHSVRFLLPLRFFGVSLPSFAPLPYRTYKMVSLRAYKEVISAIDEMSRLPTGTLNRVPILNLIRADDELVSANKVEAWLRARAGANLRSIRLNPDPTAEYDRPHIIIDEPSAGRANWRIILDEIRAFLA